MSNNEFKEIRIEDTECSYTAFYDKHIACGAQMVDFAGWMMPMMYKGIKEEHLAVRNACGLFDISHMGEIEIKGADAFSYLQRIITNDLRKIKSGSTLYTPFCNYNGNVIDDIIIYRFSKEHFMLVVNAARTHNDYQWLAENIDSCENVKVRNISDSVQALALQGPMAEKIMQTVFPGEDFAEFYHGQFRNMTDEKDEYVVSRTGYTGEDGFEIYGEAMLGLWDKIMEIGSPLGILPAGLGCRDTLRLEMGYSLYGHELSERHNPFQSGIGWTVSLDKGHFAGRESMENKEKISGKTIGFELLKRGIPRADCDISQDGSLIGRVTSGTFSPSLNKGIGLGFVGRNDISCGDFIDVVIRGKAYAAKVVKVPFYPEKRIKRKRLKNV